MYDVIITDPPYHYYGSPDKMGAAGKEYELMSDEDVLKYTYPLADDGILFCWATCPRLDLAMQHIEANGLHFRGVAFVWVKTTLAGKIIHGQGVRPSVTKPTTEMVLVGSRKKKGRPLPLADESIGQVVLAPRGKHSQKPEEVQDRIEKMYPDMTKAEFFARRLRPGWECFGDEIGRRYQ